MRTLIILWIIMLPAFSLSAQNNSLIQPPGSEHIVHLKTVKVFGHKTVERSVRFKSGKVLRGFKTALKCDENMAVFVKSPLKEYLSVYSVEIPIKRLNSEVIDTPKFYIKLNNNSTDSLIPIPPREILINKNKIVVSFDQVLDLQRNGDGFFFLMVPNCTGGLFSTNYLISVSRDKKAQFTYSYGKDHLFKIKKFWAEGQEGSELSYPFPNWIIVISFATGG